VYLQADFARAALMNCGDADYLAHLSNLRMELPDMAAEVAAFHSVEQVLQWMKRRGLTRAAVDLIGMDEFSYDFLIQLERDGRWIAFGVT
jgi:hypothetical protein